MLPCSRLLPFALLAIGCASPVAEQAADASAGADGGAGFDAGQGSDGGRPGLDAGITTDAATPPDAALPAAPRFQLVSTPRSAEAISAFSLAVADADGDQKPDVLLALVPANPGSEPPLLRALLGKGDGSFSVGPAGVPLTPFQSGQVVIVAGDFDGDGKSDVAATNYTGGSQLYLTLGLGGGAFSATGTSAFSTVAGGYPTLLDFDHDKKQDVLLSGGGGVELFAGGYPPKSAGRYQAPAGSTMQNAVVADVDHDGIPDVIAYEFAPGAPHLRVLFVKSDGAMVAGPTTPVANYGAGIVAGDFDGDREIDHAICAGTNLLVLLGKGDGTFRVTLQAVPFGKLEAAGDFNGDGALDLAGTDVQSSPQVLLSLGDGRGAFPVRLTYPALAHSLTAADFNRDGKLDLVALSLEQSTLLTVLLSQP